MFNECVFGRCCKPARQSWPRRLSESLNKTGYARAHGTAIRSFFALTFAIDADKRADINALIKHPLFDQLTQSGSEAAVLKEVAVVKRLVELRKAAEKDFSKNGALKDVELESSTDESESSSDEDEEDDDEDDDEDEDGDEIDCDDLSSGGEID